MDLDNMRIICYYDLTSKDFCLDELLSSCLVYQDDFERILRFLITDYFGMHIATDSAEDICYVSVNHVDHKTYTQYANDVAEAKDIIDLYGALLRALNKEVRYYVEADSTAVNKKNVLSVLDTIIEISDMRQKHFIEYVASSYDAAGNAYIDVNVRPNWDWSKAQRNLRNG